MGLLGWRVHSDAVTRGDRAELRRMKPDGIPPEVYWRLTDELDQHDELWMTVLPLMVLHPHERGARPGRVLARNGIKPARAQRWLRRDRARAWEEAGRFLGPARGVPFDWSRFGTLLARWEDPERRRSFAREFFSEIHKMERMSSNPTGGA
jgi:hypothetical protein